MLKDSFGIIKIKMIHPLGSRTVVSKFDCNLDGVSLKSLGFNLSECPLQYLILFWQLVPEGNFDLTKHQIRIHPLEDMQSLSMPHLVAAWPAATEMRCSGLELWM